MFQSQLTVLPSFAMSSKRFVIVESAKLVEFVDHLKTPFEYVRNVLAALARHGAKNNPDIEMRLPLRTGRVPDYRIVEIMDPSTGQTMELAVYDGRAHREMPYTDKLALRDWSGDGCKFVEAQALIGILRPARKL